MFSDDAFIFPEAIDISLTPVQADLAYCVEHTMKYLRHPNLQLRLPMGEVIGQPARTAMQKAWLEGMDEALWNIMFMFTSDVWDAIDVFNDLNNRIQEVTYLK
jgi:hypothetical protein